MKKYSLLLLIATIVIAFSACKKSSEEITSAPLSDYYPLTIGRYITYNLDSLVYINFGTSTVVHSYQVKYETDAQVTDNLGRPAYRIIRYIRSAPLDPWTADNTFMVVNNITELEFIENNQRFLKLKDPIKNNFSWKGNSHIETSSAGSEFRYLDDWDYMYANVGQQDQVNNFILDSCLTVNQRDESFDSPTYGEVNYGQEKYAAGIGMVYKKFFHSEFQRPDTTLPGYFVTGSYGITLTMIDHN